ncbi:MAG: DMT family transporter [Fibrobacter sp.]|nr:DMT family transporter [Fibrobacter sp.]
MIETQYTGSFLALSTSFLWTLAPFLFASAVRKIGAKRVNPLRLLAAGLILMAVSAVYVYFNKTVLSGLNAEPFLWLVLSGFAGLVLGDSLYLSSLGFLGPRRALQIFILSPAVSAVIAWFWLNEKISPVGISGLVLITGALFAITFLENKAASVIGEPGTFSWIGLTMAFFATLLHGSGAVLARNAYLQSTNLDPVIAATVRVGSSALLIWIWVLLRGKAADVFRSVKDWHTFSRIGSATMLGPVLGMLLYIGAFKTAPAGVVSLLSSLSPLLIIPISAWRYKTKINYLVLFCMIAASVGVVLVILR